MTTTPQGYRIPSQFEAAVQAKCPRCRRGKMFAGPMYSFKGQKMNINCPHCNLRFEREPGYFYVSMFVSYAFVVAELIGASIATHLVTGDLESPWLYIAVTLTAAVLLAPFNYRYSRVILLYWLTPGLHYIRQASEDREQ